MQATVLFHCGQHAAALKLLEPVWHALQAGNLQPGVHEELLLGGCFTLIEVNFALKRHSQIISELLHCCPNLLFLFSRFFFYFCQRV